jgi:glycosyltransferase involved in cell wall biosynthesis
MKNLNILVISWELSPMMAGGLGPLMRSAVDELRNQGNKVDVLVPYIPSDLIISDAISLQKEIKRYQKKTNLNIDNLDFPTKTFSNEDTKSTKTWPGIFSKLGTSKKPKKKLYPNNTPELTKMLAFAVRDYLKKHSDYDAIIGADWMSIASFVLLKNEGSKIPFYFYINSTEYDRSFEKFSSNNKISKTSKAIHEYEKKWIGKADGVISISDITKNVLIKYHDIEESKITVVFNDINFEPLLLGFNELQKGKNILFIGRIAEQKGLRFLIETAKKVVDTDSQVRFLIAGDGEMTPEVVKMVAELELEKNVLFLGWVNEEEKKQLYRSSDLFVMPSPSEPFGLTPLESIRSGVPVISSDSCGFLGVVPSTPTFKYYDTNQFLQMILFYLNNKDAAMAVLNNQQSDLKKHSWPKEISKIVNLINEKNYDQK